MLLLSSLFQCNFPNYFTTSLSLTTASPSESGNAMLGSHFCVRTIPGVGAVIDQPNARQSIATPFHSSFFPATMPPWYRRRNLRCNFKPIFISCNSNSGSSGARSCDAGDTDQHYFPATLLLEETLSHYRMRHGRYQEEVSWPVTRQIRPFSNKGEGPKADSKLIGQGFLHHFTNPTIFLKISCNGDLVLPIVVADYAIEKLIDAIQGGENRDCPDQFQFMKDLPEKVGCKMEMVKITERIVNTYFARLYFSKPEKDDLLSVDVRPSDAINVAYRCQVRIYVHKDIVLADALRLGYGVDRTRDTKSVYDVSLDSAEDDPDVVSEELGLVKNMNLAIKEERYSDAAMLREKLMKLRN